MKISILRLAKRDKRGNRMWEHLGGHIQATRADLTIWGVLGVSYPHLRTGRSGGVERGIQRLNLPMHRSQAKRDIIALIENSTCASSRVMQ